jgi:hypothetical protein
MEMDEGEVASPGGGSTTPEKLHQERRNSIHEILADDGLTPLEKRRSIQCLMDGRRRSSNATRSSSDGSEPGMARAAAEAAEFYSSDTDVDVAMDGTSNSEQHANYQQQGQEHQQQQQQDAQDWDTPHRRRERSASLPGWSETGMNQAVAPLAAASQNPIWDDPINVNRRMEKSRPACSHYERNCTIISQCCGLAFGCRICHDDCPVLPLPFSKRDGGGQNQSRVNWSENVESLKQKKEKRRSLPLGFDEEETHHEIDRFKITEVICRLCHVRQSSKT